MSRSAILFVIYYIFAIRCVKVHKYYNETLEPAARQLLDFKLHNTIPIGILTTSSGAPVDIRETVNINTDSLASQFHLDLITHFTAERIPERGVHAKGTAAFGYFEVTHDISKYTKADVFNSVGKKTPLVARFSIGNPNLGGTDFSRDLSKGIAIKFYTKEGNFDLLCLHIPIFVFNDPVNFTPLVHVALRNPSSNLYDSNMRWDLFTKKPEIMHSVLWSLSDYGIPTGYRNIDGFPIHTYEFYNKNGERFYARFNFRTEQGLANFTTAQAQEISGRDPDYYTRDLFNAIERKVYPTWKLELELLTLKDIKNLDYNPFDMTRLWKKGTYNVIPVGRMVFNENPKNQFKDNEISAYNPSNLVPGINGVDEMFRVRSLSYRDTQNTRLGVNHNKIDVNYPKYEKTYNRHGVAPVRDNMEDTPHYYPNSFNGPLPYVDESRPRERLIVLQSTAADLQPASDFYNQILTSDGEKQRLSDNIAASLETVTPTLLLRAMRVLTYIDPDLAKRVIASLNALKVAPPRPHEKYINKD